MAGQIINVNDSELKKFIRDLSFAHFQVARTATFYSKKIGALMRSDMMRFAKGRTPRSTGALSNSVMLSFKSGENFRHVTVAVSPSIPYRFAAEYGFSQTKRYHYGRPLMSFNTSEWPAAGKSPANTTGDYFFARVRRGRYQGLRYGLKTYESAKNHFQNNVSNITRALRGTVVPIVGA